MKRPLRRLLNGLAVLSLLLCLATGTLWMISIPRWDALYIGTESGSLWSIASSDGRLTVSRYWGWPDASGVRWQGGRHLPPNFDLSKMTAPVYGTNGPGGARSRQWNWWCLDGATGAICVVNKPDGSAEWDAPVMARLRSTSSNRYSAPMPFWTVTVPHWLYLTLFGVLPAFAVCRTLVVRVKRHPHRSKGCCPTCGYDLRATPDRCPECGNPPAREKA